LNLPGIIKLILSGSLVLILQAAVLNKLTLAGGIIDLVLLFLILQSGKYSRTQSLIMAAILGFLADATTDLWGLHLFSKVSTIYLFHPLISRIQNNRFLFWQIALYLFLILFTHNAIFITISLFTELYASEFVVATKLFSDTLFTLGVGLIYYFTAGNR
jgi:rod shape-determining protein MreD